MTGAALVVFAGLLTIILTTAPWSSVVRLDRGIYQDAALRWIHGGFWYYPEQTAGPYVITVGHNLYPPVALLMLAPAAFLPDAVWWGVPVVVTAAAVRYHRPAVWTWPLMALCLAWPWSVEVIALGNPTIWVVMFVALGTRWPAAFALVLLKPSLFPVALLGIRHRGWWLILGGLILTSIALLPMTIDYVAVLLNGRGPLASPFYSLGSVPLLAIPLVAWLGRSAPVRTADTPRSRPSPYWHLPRRHPRP